MTQFIFPSVLFVAISYSSFWINKESAPARVTLAIMTILISINFLSAIHRYLPQIPYNTWLSNYMLGIQIFTVVTMI